jgi:hypothetical protein
MVLDPEKIQIELFLYHGLLCKGLGYVLHDAANNSFNCNLNFILSRLHRSKLSEMSISK